MGDGADGESVSEGAAEFLLVGSRQPLLRFHLHRLLEHLPSLSFLPFAMPFASLSLSL